MKRIGLPIVAALVALGFACSNAQAHAIACSNSNSHYRELRAHRGVLKRLIIVPGNPGVRCSIYGRMFILRIVGPCTTYFQTATVLSESRILGHIVTTRWRVDNFPKIDGFNRCFPYFPR